MTRIERELESSSRADGEKAGPKGETCQLSNGFLAIVTCSSRWVTWSNRPLFIVKVLQPSRYEQRCQRYRRNRLEIIIWMGVTDPAFAMVSHSEGHLHWFPLFLVSVGGGGEEEGTRWSCSQRFSFWTQPDMRGDYAEHDGSSASVGDCRCGIETEGGS